MAGGTNEEADGEGATRARVFETTGYSKACDASAFKTSDKGCRKLGAGNCEIRDGELYGEGFFQSIIAYLSPLI